MEFLSCCLTWPPYTGNDQYGTTQSGKRFLKTEVNEWRFFVREQCLRRWGLLPKVPHEGPMSMLFICHPPHRRGYDLDNLSKMIGDALEWSGLIKNDRDIMRSLGVKESQNHRRGYIDVILGPVDFLTVPDVRELLQEQNRENPNDGSHRSVAPDPPPCPPAPEVIQCPHGEDPAECNACMIEADYRFDASRESRFFGRD